MALAIGLQYCLILLLLLDNRLVFSRNFPMSLIFLCILCHLGQYCAILCKFVDSSGAVRSPSCSLNSPVSAQICAILSISRCTSVLSLNSPVSVQCCAILLVCFGTRVASYFTTLSYEVGGEVFSMADLEHCVLRAKTSQPKQVGGGGGLLACLALPWLVMACLCLACLVLAWLVLVVLSCLVVSCVGLCCLVLSCLVLPCLGLPFNVLCFLVLSSVTIFHVPKQRVKCFMYPITGFDLCPRCCYSQLLSKLTIPMPSIPNPEHQFMSKMIILTPYNPGPKP